MFSNKTPQIARNKNNLRTIEAESETVQKRKKNEPRPKFTGSYKKHVKAFWSGTSRLNNKIKVKNKNIKWAEEKVKALGVWFTLDVNKTQMLNYTERREK